VPEISRFFGIIITINYREHDPPHFTLGTAVPISPSESPTAA
jgi:hypothetical protein